MKAVRITKYGTPEVLQLVDVELPVPAADEVLVKIQAASLNISDYYRMKGGPTRLLDGLRAPKDPRSGKDMAGVVQAAGKEARRFHPGDAVFGYAAGSFAEFACGREKNLVLKPANITYEQAAAVPIAALTALQGLRDAGQVKAGQRVLIQGASGGVGTFAVQVARALGADVTAVCSSRNVEQARSLGASRVIDYSKEDFTHSGQMWDLIFAVNGYHSIFEYKRALAPSGTYVMVGASPSKVMLALLEVSLLGKLFTRREGQTLLSMGIAKINQEDLTVLSTMLETGKIVPAIDQIYPLDQATEAYRYMGGGHPRAKIVISVGGIQST